MTILVVFGIPNNFGVPHGRLVHGNNEDRIYFATDTQYDGANDDQLLPHVNDKTMLPVIQHKSGSGNHESQLNWLKADGKYYPTNVEYFSHGVGNEPFETIKRLLNPPSDQDVSHKDQVSSFVKQYSNRAILENMDHCAAWNALFLVSGLQLHEDEMNKYMNLVQPFVVEELNSLKDNEWLLALEEAATSFC